MALVKLLSLRSDAVFEEGYFLIELFENCLLNLRESLALQKVTDDGFVDLKRHLQVLDLAQVLFPLRIHELLFVPLHGLSYLDRIGRVDLVACEDQGVRGFGVG